MLFGLSPECRSVLVQALVEHFSQKGQPDAVEKAVLHMDIASLDLNQVTPPHTNCLPASFSLGSCCAAASWLG